MLCYRNTAATLQVAAFLLLNQNVKLPRVRLYIGEKGQIMKRKHILFFVLVMTAVMVFSFGSSAFAGVTEAELDKKTETTAAYIQKTVTNPTVSSIGGEWAIIGLARSNVDVPQSYYDKYYNNVVKTVKECNGVLHSKKYTEYFRVILALTAIGKNPADVGGYNLLTPLGDYDKTVYQGINSAVFALLALDSADYAMPVNSAATTQATRDMYINYILQKQLADGGWALSGTVSDPDVTAMALQALAKYQNKTAVKTAVNKGIECLSALQKSDGGFVSYNASNCESVAQVIVALDQLNISYNDSRFIKNGNTVLDALMMFYVKDGSFKHILNGEGNNLMATEQGFYAMVAAQRNLRNQNSLYDMKDAVSVSFPDIKGHKNEAAIIALAEAGIINGMPNGNFEPNSTMTRAEFATIVVRALELTPKETTVFKDVKPGLWYSGYIGAAYNAGIVKGTSANMFTPNATITREEATTMVARAAAVCGLKTELTPSQTDEALKPYTDSKNISVWAKDAFAYCCYSGIWQAEGNTLQPQKPILRAEIAQMIYNMLNLAGKM